MRLPGAEAVRYGFLTVAVVCFDERSETQGLEISLQFVLAVHFPWVLDPVFG